MFGLTHFWILSPFLHLSPSSLYDAFWHTVFSSDVIWAHNWKFTNLPLYFVQILGFEFFHLAK